MKDVGLAPYVLRIQIHKDRNKSILENVLNRYTMQVVMRALSAPIVKGDRSDESVTRT